MIAWLGPTDPFPPHERALGEPNGLLAVGGGLSTARLVSAYRQGIFPWFNPGDPVLWWSPNPRTVLPTDQVHVSRSLRRRIGSGAYRFTLDRAFDQVIAACAAPREPGGGTWLVPAMVRAYERLHAVGLAHSAEVWVDDRLAGGLYGVAIGRMFFGESMFTRVTDASKVALVCLAAQLGRWGFPLIDCQQRTDHLVSLGAIEVAREAFTRDVHRLVSLPDVPAPWREDDRPVRYN